MTTPSYQDFLADSELAGGNFDFLEGLYEDFLRDPHSVNTDWQDYFTSLAGNAQAETLLTPVRESFMALAKQPAIAAGTSGNVDLMHERKQEGVVELVNHYRAFGHRCAKIDPVGLAPTLRVPELELINNGLSAADLNTVFSSGNFSGLQRAPLKEIIAALEKTYCGSIGAEFMHITDSQQRNWLLEKFEKPLGQPHYAKEIKLRILDRLTAAEGLEKYLHNKYVGQKRFSLEGGETFIPMLDHLSNISATDGVNELIIGMAHRGRLNVLVNIMGKAPQELFDQFDGKHLDDVSGDVKYHLGFSSTVETTKGPLNLSLAFNPSHLEIVSPVVEGAVRAKQEWYDSEGVQAIIPVLIHGDASFAGQGVIMETFNLSQVKGYKTGGSVHIVINNQVGFTTDPVDDRSTLYCTDVAKMVEAPIFHVNGDDPEACLFATQLALEFRMKFNRDVVIDLVCYRRLGHNEADEPAATQPLLYKAIRAMQTTWALYAEKLVKEQIISATYAADAMKQYHARLAVGKPVVEFAPGGVSKEVINWQPHLKQPLDQKVDTGVAKKVLVQLGEIISTIPTGFKPHPRIEKIIEARQQMTKGEVPMDWGYAENLAYASLLVEGHKVRISGQDVERGTFFHRHAVWHNVDTGAEYIPLAHVDAKQAAFVAINSILSEEAVMGFDCGYAMSAPNDLVIWEAQYGDFANGAQVIIDQFLSSMEQKWRLNCGLVLLLPHGQEGGGPEHSSARLERYLQMCAQDNMQVCVPTTPAQVFHMLRRQVIRLARKPLIVMSPKSFVRSKVAVSALDELTHGEYQLLIPEAELQDKAKITKVVLCSGKVYYDLLQKRQDNKQQNVALIRIEQLYPFPVKELSAQLASYPQAKQVVWCQEEPQNQGAWYSTKHNLEAALTAQQKLQYVGRPALAAPAGGYLNTFTKEQEKLVNEALA